MLRSIALAPGVLGRDGRPIISLHAASRCGKRLLYATLSYSWGVTSLDGSHLTHSVTCDDGALKVTSTLDRALRRIREIPPSWWAGIDGDDDSGVPGTSIPLLWIDAICINQHDPRERGREVDRMGETYKQSACLIIWLGELAEGEDGNRFREAISLDKPGTEVESLRECQWRDSLDYFEHPWGYDYDPVTRSSLLSTLLHRPYFRRRWCIQEATHTWGTAVVMLIGGSIFRAKDVRHATYKLLLLQGINVLDPRDLKRVDALAQPDKHTLRYLSQECDLAECSLEHDRVYSLLSLARDASVYDLTVDYTQSMDEMCRDIMRGAADPKNAEDGHAFQLIVIATSRPRQNMISPCELPSWIPAWRAHVLYASDEHQRIAECFAYPLYQVPSSHLKVENDFVSIKGEMIQPCFPPRHTESTSTCPCCTYWKPKWCEWTSQLRSQLCNANEQGHTLFTPSFQRMEHFSRLFESREITFVLVKSASLSLAPKGQQQVYQLSSCFDSTRSSSASSPQDSAWVCIG